MLSTLFGVFLFFQSPQMFKPFTIHAVPKGIPKPRLELILKVFKANGGVLGNELESNLVLASRDSLQITHKPQVDPDWISDSIIAGKALDFVYPAKLSNLNHNASSSGSKRKEGRSTQAQTPKKHKEMQDLEPNLSTIDKNQLIISELQKLLDRYTVAGEKYRSSSYKKAIDVIKKHPTQLTSGKEAKKLAGVGESISSKIQEIIDTGRTKKNDEAPSNIGILKEFMKIYDAGSVHANKWYDDGCRTIEDVAKRTDLSKGNIIGIRHFNDFNEKMQRSEVQEIFEEIQTILKPLKETKVLCMGSYVRGMQECGDIDLILYVDKDNVVSKESETLLKAVELLQQKGVLTDSLSLSNEKLLGVYKTKSGKYRRIDMLLTTKENLGAAKMHFTGNKELYHQINLVTSGSEQSRIRMGCN
jgi:DNA polymerase/3'-5' exonuclease PolX